MATSLQDVLDEVIRRAQHTAGDPDRDDCIGALAPAGRALQRLVDDGLDSTGGSMRDLAVADLASACARAASVWPTGSERRLSDLIGVAADMVGLRRGEIGCAGRWAAAVAITETVRGCVQGAQRYAPEVGLPTLDRVRRCAAVVERLAAQDPPSPARAAILDRPVPVGGLPAGLPGHRVAAEAAAVILDQLTGPARRDHLALTDVLATALAAETAACRGVALATTPAARAPDRWERSWRDAPTAWRLLFEELHSFDDGSRQHPTAPAGTAMWAWRLHRGLHQELPAGPTTSPSVSDHAAIADARRVVAYLPGIAQALDGLMTAWVHNGTLLTRASMRCLGADGRVRQPGELMRADRRDLIAVTRAVRAAQLLSAALAAELSRDNEATVTRAMAMPWLAATHQAHVSGERSREEMRRRADQTRRRFALHQHRLAAPWAR